MTEQKKSEDIIVRMDNVRIAFPAVFVAEQVGGKGKPAFSATFLMTPEHPAIVLIKEGIKKAAVDKWGDEAAAILQQLVAGDRVCLRNGNTKANYEGFAGNMFVSARGYTKPLVINADKSPLIETDGKPYSGCYVNGQISIWAQQNQYGKRINAQLGGVQFLADGESFGGGHVADVSEFDTVAEGGADDAAPTDAVDPLEGLI
jgi:hypothetical protein